MKAARLALLLAALASLSALGACGGQYLTPPTARIGDATITVTVRLASPGQFAPGSKLVITLADVTGYTPSPLAGDTLTLAEPDRSVRVTLPADKQKIARCQTPGICGIYVRVTSSGNTMFRNAKPVPYTLSKKNVTVSVTAR